MKSFRYDFARFLTKVMFHQPFAFGRFSDGQLFIMQGKHLTLGNGITRIGDNVTPSNFQPEDHKNFDPKQHKFYQQRLMQAYKFKKHNYYKGLSCRCCVGQQSFKWMIEQHGGDDQSLTWSNLFVNRNYPLFIQKMVPYFKAYKVYMVCNQKADLTSMPFKVQKDFRVGYNCMVNNYGLIGQVQQYIRQQNVHGALFLFSASTLSNFLAHQLFQMHDDNTYMDIGTTLNYYMKMRLDRSYLDGYWNKREYGDLKKVCIW